MKTGNTKHKTISTPERRYLSTGELRIKSDDSKQKIVGYAAKFAPVTTSDLGGFIEQIDPHAFDACLAANPDCRALWNHDPNHVLGRTTAGTLRLSTDSSGLRYEIDPPATNMAKDLMILMQRGDVSQSSYGFFCLDDSWEQKQNGQIVRTVLKATLIDVSPVTFPATDATTTGVRSLALRNAPAALRKKLRDAVDDIIAEDTDDDSDTIQTMMVAVATVTNVKTMTARIAVHQIAKTKDVLNATARCKPEICTSI